MAIAEKIRQINALIQEVREYKSAHPEAAVGFYERNVGSLLNAYREGDIGFDDCVQRLEAIAFPKDKTQRHGQVSSRECPGCTTTGGRHAEWCYLS
jgi:hypothetical protein